MATRYTGTLKLTIRYNDRTSSYTVRIQELNDEARFKTLSGIRLSPHDQQFTACDSPRAYDLIARAAISFGANEDEMLYAFATTDMNGEVMIGRTQRAAAAHAEWCASEAV